MNITSTVCWSNIWGERTLLSVGIDVLSLRNDNVIKFIELPTSAVNYFSAESSTTGHYISVYTSHTRFPLFAFAEAVLNPQIFVYKYPEMTRLSTLIGSPLDYIYLKFSEGDILVAMGGYPDYTICVFNYRTSTLILEQPTRVAGPARAFSLSNGNMPTIIQMNRQEVSVLCYEITVGEISQLHKISEIELGKLFSLSLSYCLCYGDDNCPYVVNDMGSLSQIEFATFMLKPRWSPEHAPIEPRAHTLTVHKMGLVIANSVNAYYVTKKKGNHFVLEWSIDNMIQGITRFVSNGNGELYAERSLGSIYQVIVNDNVGQLEPVILAGERVKQFRFLNGIKDEVALLLQVDKLVVVDLLRGNTLHTIPIESISYMSIHRAMPYVVAGTTTAQLILLFFEKVTVCNTLCELQCNTKGVVAMQYHDNWVVYLDEERNYHMVYVEYKPYNMTYSFTFSNEQIPKEINMHCFRLVEGPRLLAFISRDKNTLRPEYSNELWIYTWGRDKRLQIRQFILPHSYVGYHVTPPVSRWVTVEIFCVRKDTIIFDQYNLTEQNVLQLVSSIKTHHFGYITGISATKHILTCGVGGLAIHFRQHKKSKKPFIISRFLKVRFVPKYLIRARECFNSKYLVTLSDSKCMMVVRLPSLTDYLKENIDLMSNMDPIEIEQIAQITSTIIPLDKAKADLEQEYAVIDYKKRDKVIQSIAEFAGKVTELIDYDISVTGQSKGIFKKFCFHYKWLDAVTQEAKKLCKLERESMELATKDQARIRDWIMQLVTANSSGINYKVRAIFSDTNFENYAPARKTEPKDLDRYRFYDLEDHVPMSVMSIDDVQEDSHGGISDTDKDKDGESMGFRELKPYVVEGPSVYKHIMSPIFQLQDKNIVTSNQVFNVHAKYPYYIFQPLKEEFNKLFHEAQQMKQDTIDSVLNTNAVLYKIYDNMNIMLRLLNMDTFIPPQLSVPRWAPDEVIKKILEVEESEIQAINRRRKKTIDMWGKRGRLLLWSVEFWSKALMIMMDGVLEKLWEEEIKKEVPLPEFMIKKQPHEYSLEDQKLLKIYEEAVRQLADDRRKYLGILHENELKTLDLKTTQILKLNKHISELMLLKLQYDFALKQETLRVLNLKTVNFSRVQLAKRIQLFRGDSEKLNSYIQCYTKLMDFWENAQTDVRAKLEAQQAKDRTVDRQFRNNFLNTVPHATHELTKLFKKRPKMSNKVFSTTLICNETANKLIGKPSQRTAFPLGKEVIEFLAMVDEFDQIKQCPQQVDAKSWETFVKLRRQKIESELRLKGVGFQLIDSQQFFNSFNKDVNNLKEAKVMVMKQVQDNTQSYLEAMRNMTLQLTLTLGQIEVGVAGQKKSLAGTVLMHMDDINVVNKLIYEAGSKKLKAMQRVAVFRRQVIFKEWEHKLYRANISYLKYMLEAIEKCKVSIEFLNILRNWHKVKKERQKFMAAGALDHVVEFNIAAHRRHINRVNEKIDKVRAQILQTKRDSHTIDAKIERLRVDVAFQTAQRDTMLEERRDREQRERMSQIQQRRKLMESVRNKYAHVLELQTILELLRLRTYPTLGPPLPQCHPPVPDHILSSII